MREIFISVLFLSCLLTASGQRQMTMPAFLKPGDSIAVISPCSTPEEKTVADGCAILRQWGYVPVVGRHALDEDHGFAGTADDRASDLLWALRDSTIRAIMCSRGGDGAVQVLMRVPLSEYRRHPKWLIGFSDVTALHSASVQAGVMSIHGSMCYAIAAQEGTDTVSVTLRRLLQGELPRYQLEPHSLNQYGTAEGMLVGGNFSVFCGLAGSDYDFLRQRDIILFIEDTDEEMTKVDRMLHLLEVRGILQRLKAVIVGHFTDYKRPKNDFDDMYHMLHHYLQHYPIPVVYGFPVGHARPNFPLIEGAQVRLTVTPKGTTMQYKGRDPDGLTPDGLTPDPSPTGEGR